MLYLLFYIIVDLIIPRAGYDTFEGHMFDTPAVDASLFNMIEYINLHV